MEINLPTTIGTRYTRLEDDCDYRLIWDWDQLCVDVPSVKVGKDTLIILQDQDEENLNDSILVTTLEKLSEEFERAPENIETTVEEEK